MLFAGIRKAVDVIDPARPGFPMRHEGPFWFMLGQRCFDDLRSHGLSVGDFDDRDACGLRVQAVGG